MTAEPRYSPLRLLTAALMVAAMILLSGVACRSSATTAGPTVELAPSETARPPASTPTAEISPTRSAPPLQGRIVFTCQIFGESSRNQICILEPNGGGFARLTTEDSVDHFYPSWTPDGQAVVYSADLAGGYEIFEHPIGGSPRQLTRHGRTYAPAVSPDGARFAYTVRHGQDVALWIADRDGSDERWLIGQAWDATWSPDGAWILHASDRGGSIQLWVVHPDGTGLRQVTQLERLRGRSDWSSDGNRLATYAGPTWQREIVSFNPRGEDIRWLTSGGNNLAPSFSPGGDWIVFTSYVDRYRDDHGCEIYAMRNDGSDRIRLTDNDVCDWQPRWGP